MTAAAVDTAYLAASLTIPEPNIQTLLDAPTVELVTTLLEAVGAKLREYDAIKAEKLKSDIELENAVRSGDARARALKASVDKGLKDVEELRRKLNDEETARTSLERELEQLKSSSSDSASEIQSLRKRISTLEGSNRETLALLEAKSTAHDKVAEELSAQHQKMIGLRKEVASLEEKNQSLDNASMGTKFREQTLQQEIDLLKKNNEWYEAELRTSRTKHTEFRKEKNSQIAELQRRNEDATQTIESLRRTEATLRARLEEVNQKAEDGLSRIQQLQEAAAKAEESFRMELDSAQRLADLQKQSADTARARLQTVQANLEKTTEDAAAEIGQMQAEVETERTEKEAAERRVAELELQVEQLEAAVSAARPNVALPGTPKRGINGASATPAGAASPFTPGTTRRKGVPTSTELFSQLAEAQSELDAERRKNQKLSATVEDMLNELESKQPEMEEMRVEQERLASEVIQVSSLLEEATKEREAANKEVRRRVGQIEGLERETNILRQQLRDMSAQIKILLVEIQAREQGLDALDAQGQAELERLARQEIGEDALAGMTDTGRYISERLTIFRNVKELQEQNIQLLRITRELGDQMEGEEAKAKANEREKERQELEQLRESVESYKDQIHSLATRAESFVKERDMFRRMLTHRGQLPPGADLQSIFAQSVDGRATVTPPPAGLLESVEQSPNSKDIADYAKLIKELQAHFDAYRQETSTDHAALKQQADRLAKEKSELQARIAQLSSQLTLERERYELLRANVDYLKSENSELQKRSQSLAETAARQDIRTQQAVEDLAEYKSLTDSKVAEISNLKAEKELWKKIEARLSEDNRVLMDEKARLNKMLSDLQHVQNERTLADSETHRRLQTRAESLEAELQTTKRKLDNEVEEGRKAALRREYETEQNRARIDDLVAGLGKAREELIAAQTQRDQLQARVEELKIDLRNAEEKTQALQPRPTPRDAAQEADANVDASGEEGLSREQELALEISDLKRDLELARSELHTAKTHVEQYKSFSQAAEEELQNLNETNDQYREEMDRVLAEKDAKVQDLERRVEEISAELATTNSELSALRTAQEETTVKFNEQKAMLDEEITRLKDECERYAETSRLHQEDLRAQAEIAQRAQQSYENELVKHGEATKNLHKVRAEYNQLKTEVAAIKADAQAARTTLAQSEESWAESRARYERELAELRKRREDINAQNKLLHQQLENVSEQIAALKQSRTSFNDDEENAASPAPGLDNLQEVIRYLRREKEIVDVQYELSIQESKRLKQQLDHTQAQLDQTREKLNQERQSQADREQSALSHSELLKTINELNTFRESNTTLRNEARQAQSQLATKVKEVESLLAELQPVKSRLREVESELEMKEGELKLAQEDRDRWQQRAQNILQKYDRIDPEELEGLKNEIITKTAERDAAHAECEQLREQMRNHPDEQKAREDAIREELAKAYNERRQAMVNQFKDRSKELTGKIREKDSEIQAITQTRDELARTLDGVKQELEDAKAARDEALANVNQSDTRMGNSIEEGQVDESAVEALKEEKDALQLRLSQVESEKNEQANLAARLQTQVEALQKRVQELEAQVANLQKRLDDTTAELAVALSSVAQPQAPDGETIEALEKLKIDFAAAQSELETLRTNAAIASSITNITQDDSKPLAEQVAEQVAKQAARIEEELKVKHEERVKAAEELHQRRTDVMRKQLSTKLTAGKEAYRLELSKEKEEELQRLRTEHETQIARLKEEHQAELDRVRKEAETAIEQAKKDGRPGSSTAAPSTEPAGGNRPAGEWKPSDAEIKDLIATSPVVKAIVTRNIQTKLNQEREALITRVRDEQQEAMDKKLAEAAEEAEKKKTAATDMAEKKWSLKVNMASNQLRGAQAKLEVVEQAARETPQKDVASVWELARNARPKPQQAATNAPGGLSVQATPPANASATRLSPSQPQPGMFTQPQPGMLGRGSGPGQLFSQQGQLLAPQFGQQGRFNMQAGRGFGSPTNASANFPQVNAVSETQSIPQPQAPPTTETNLSGPPAPQMAQAIPTDSTTSQPPQPAQSTSGQTQVDTTAQPRPPNSAAVGTGPSALRGVLTQGVTNLPRGGGTAGTSIPRPGGRGQQANPNLPQQAAQTQPAPNAQQQTQAATAQGAGNNASQLPRGSGGAGRGGGGRGARGGRGQHGQQGGIAQGSPRGGAAMNPSAKQFVPGSANAKRAREDGGEDGGDGVGRGKRARGGGGGN